MTFTGVLLDQLWQSRTPFVVLACIVIATIVARDPRVENYRIKAALTLLLAHLVAVTVAAIQIDTGYDPQIAKVASLAFELLAVVTLGMTAVFRALLPRVGLTLPRILIDLLTAVAMLVVFIIVGRRAGFSVAGLITTSAVLTAVIGFSLQDTLGSVMGGLSLQLDKSVSVGDWISMGADQPAGRVTEIRWRYTAIETRAWDTIIIPNNALVKSQVRIIGRRTGVPLRSRRQVDFFVDFRTPPTIVIEAVAAAIDHDPVARMALEPAPQVLFIGVRDSFAHYCVRYWLTDLEIDDPTDSAVRVRVWFALRRAEIPMSIPASTVFLTQHTAERADRKASEEIARRTRALASVDLLSGLPEASRAALVDQLVYMPFAAGEAVTREGDRDDGLYILVDGEARVRIGTGHAQRDVATLSAGEFFGEMSLMTGAARTASVIASTDLVTYRIDKPAFQQVLDDTPALADQIADLLVARRAALSAARDEHDVTRASQTTAKQDLVGKIRGFFGLDHRG